MKKFITILTCLLLIGAAGVMIFATGAIYDVGTKVTPIPYFFQPNDFSSDRIGKPMTPAEFGSDKIRDMLVRRFISEYFYVIPDTENVSERTQYRSTNPFARMTQKNVFDNWVANIAPQIKDMATSGVMRTVHFRDDLTDTGIMYDKNTEYWTVDFDLYTWNTPNDFNVAPVITHHKMLMRFNFSMDMSDKIKSKGVHKHLDDGGDPADLFRINVTEVIVK